jgi:hypothetical protein
LHVCGDLEGPHEERLLLCRREDLVDFEDLGYVQAENCPLTERDSIKDWDLE